MAKKKKTTETTKPQVVDENSEETTTEANLTYTGTVTIAVRDGKSTVSTKTYKNAGDTPLFTFLYNCLVGNFIEASKTRPNKIMLFYNDNASPTAGFNPKQSLLTSYISANSATFNTTDGAILHFLIPFASFKSEATKINQIALYSQNKTISEFIDKSAYYSLVDEYGEWAPIEVEDNKNFNLIIEWKLSIANAK